MSIQVTPASPTLAKAATLPFAATGHYSDNSTRDLTTQVVWSSGDSTIATVSNAVGANGVVTGKGIGTTTIVATGSGISGSSTLTVTAPVLASIQVMPGTSSLAMAASGPFTATGVYGDGTTEDLTNRVTWSSGDASIATISNEPGSCGIATGVGAGNTSITAAYGNVTGTATLTVASAALATIQVTPSTPSIAKGMTQQFTATGTFTDGTTRDLTYFVAWGSSNPLIATISNATGSFGVASGLGVGNTLVQATFGGITGSVSLNVTAAALVTIQVSPATFSLAKGTSTSFTATGIYTDRTTQDLTGSVTWSSDNTSVATVSNTTGSNGRVTAAGVGADPVTITATLGSLHGSERLTVTSASLQSIEVTPTSPSIANGTKRLFTATGIFSDATTQDLTSSVTWKTGDATVATISNAAGSHGVATGTGVGTTPVTATAGGVSGSTPLSVTAATLVSIDVTPASPVLAKGTSASLTATGIYTDGTTQDLTNSVIWSSDKTSTATVSNATGSNGRVTAAGVGADPVTITATLDSIHGSASLTVTAATLQSIEVAPASPSIANGTTRPFTATGIFSDATTQDLTSSVTWSTDDATVATISSTGGSCGVATATGAGTTSVTATSGGISGSTPLRVTAATLVSIDLTPASPILAKGTTKQLTATGTYSDGSTQDLTSTVLWSSGNSGVATVSNATGSHGLVKGMGSSAATIAITATAGGVSASTPLAVTDATLVSLSVTPDSPSIAKGVTQQFTATGTFTDLSTQDLTSSVTWSSGDVTVATVSNAAGSHGLATGAGAGPNPVAITAISGGVTGSANLSVTAATLVSIAVTPSTRIIPFGTNLPFTATGTYSDGTTLDLTNSVTWNSSDNSNAPISNAAGSKGFASATGVSFTPITITATLTPATGTASLLVDVAQTYSNTSAVSVKPTNALVMAGYTLIVDASTLTGTNTLVWDGSAELDGSFDIKAGSSTATLTGGAGNDTFDFTAPGVIFSSADTVKGGGGNDTLLIGQVAAANALTGVSNVETIRFSDNAAVNITTANTLVASGSTLTVDATALTGSHLFTWNGSSESDGSFVINGGSSDSTITGGAKDDVINAGTGSNTINGGPGNDTINLGLHTGSDKIYLNDLTKGMDTITGFVASGSIHDVIHVSTACNLYFVTSGGGNVSANAVAVGILRTASGAFSYDGSPSPANLVILADAAYANSSAVITALGTGGTDVMTFSHTVGSNAEVLVVYSDGTNAHVIGINANPYGSVSAGSSSSNMTYTDLATINSVTVADLSSWSSGAFHF